MATEKVGILIELENADNALATLRRIDSTVRELGRKRTMIKLDDGSLVSVDERIKQIQDRLAALNAAKKMGVITPAEAAEAKRLSAELKVISRGLKDATANAKTFAQTFNGISSKVAHIGSAMQSLGNAMVRVTSPMRRLTTGLLMGAGYKALNLFTEGLNGAFERYDVMKNYSRTLEAFGFSAEQAQESIEKLNDSVLGLPTGLDEIVAAQKVYVGATNDLAKSTDIAIAANNTFLASGMGSREQRFMQKYLVALGSGANLAATQWDSMARIAPMAMRAVSKELNYADGDYQQFISDAKKGNVAVEDFLNAFIEVGESGTIADAANVMKMSFEGLSANIQNAAKRMGEGTIKALDEVFQGYNGRTLLQTLLGVDANGKDMGDGVKHWIDSLSQSVQGWIKSHPQEIMDFFNDLKAIDWKGLAQGFAEGAMWFARLVSSFAKLASGKDLSKLGRAMVKMNALGNALLVGGGFLKGTRHLWGLLGAGGKWLFGGRLPKFGILDRIMAFFGSTKSIERAKELPTAAQTLRGVVSSLSGLLKIGGGIAIAGGTAWFATTAVKGMLNDLKEIGSIISSGEIDWGSAAKAMGGFAAFVGSFAGLAYVMGDIGKLTGSTAGLTTLKTEAILGGIVTLALGIADLDLHLIKDSFKQFEGVTDSLGKSVNNLNSLKEVNMGDVKERIGSVIDAMTQAYASLKVKDDEGRSLMAASDQELNAMQTIIGGMANILNTIVPINDKMRELSKAKLIGSDDAQAVGEKISGILEGLNTAFTTFLGGDYGANPSDISSDMASTIGNFNTALGSLIGENGLFNTMRKVLTQTRDIPGVQTIGSVMGSIKRLLTDEEGGLFATLKEIGKSANEMGDTAAVESKMANFANAFESIRVVFRKLKRIKKLTSGYSGGDIPGMSAVRNLISQLQSAFDTNTVNQINSQISSFVEQINGLLEAVSQINAKDGKIDIQIHLTDHIYGKEKVLSDIKKIQSDVQAAVNSIKTYYSKNITVTVTANADTSGVASTIGSIGGTIGQIAQNSLPNSVTPAKGGMIYRAGGGGVPWRRRGTDTVPAMLTPGEYVHNRRAVNMFGIDFMRKVNNLDVKGAMNELMHRAGHMANINRGATITNNYNNNQKVVINNNGNSGAGFTFKSASRFVGAL